MAETISSFLVGKGISKEIVIFLISLMPVFELRGCLRAASFLDVDFVNAFFICLLGNIIPIPFILIFIRKIFQFLRDKRGFKKIIEKLEVRSMRKSDKVKRWRDWGLLLFVAIPLPGTGGWTGALIAALLDMRIRKSLPIISLGVLLAGIIMSVLTYFIPALFGF
jgi:uncharacterized membrane protein